MLAPRTTVPAVAAVAAVVATAATALVVLAFFFGEGAAITMETRAKAVKRVEKDFIFAFGKTSICDLKEGLGCLK